MNSEEKNKRLNLIKPTDLAQSNGSKDILDNLEFINETILKSSNLNFPKILNKWRLICCDSVLEKDFWTRKRSLKKTTKIIFEYKNY